MTPPHLRRPVGPLLTAEEERALGRRAQAGDQEAVAILVERNMGLVGKELRRYAASALEGAFGIVDLDDLEQIGAMVLIEKAIPKWDPERGLKFSTYAVGWIRQAIGRHLADTANTIRTPVHMAERLRVIGRATERLTAALDRPPTDEELIAETGIDAEKVEAARQAHSAAAPFSLDRRILGRDNEDRRLMDLLPDDGQDVEAEALTAAELATVRQALAALRPRDREILIRKVVHGETLEEIGARVGLTRERVRQLLAQAIDAVRDRHPLPILVAVGGAERTAQTWAEAGALAGEDPLTLRERRRFDAAAGAWRVRARGLPLPPADDLRIATRAEVGRHVYEARLAGEPWEAIRSTFRRTPEFLRAALRDHCAAYGLDEPGVQARAVAAD